VLPELALGALLGVRLSPSGSHFGLELSGMLLASQSAEERPGAGGEFSQFGGELAAVWSADPRRGSGFSLASGLQTGAVLARGYGFTADNQKELSYFLTAFLDVELSWALGAEWALLVRPGVGVPLWRDSFEATLAGESREIFRASPLAAELALGLAFTP
jgi:hypothetical protein